MHSDIYIHSCRIFSPIFSWKLYNLLKFRNKKIENPKWIVIYEIKSIFNPDLINKDFNDYHFII